MIYALNGTTPQIDPTAWVAPDANIIGNVVIGPNASVWFGATLRGDTEPITIGAGSNVQENVVIHTDPGYPVVVGADCTIGHQALLHGCQVEECALVGMAATVLNGAVVGTQTLVGAAALVTEGKSIPSGSMVLGAPAKVVRELSEEERAGLAVSAETYRARSRQFAETLMPVR